MRFLFCGPKCVSTVSFIFCVSEALAPGALLALEGLSLPEFVIPREGK